ncbi:hypothetical protein VTI74DRAFT_10118 [Chaetomium olivicolor]
MEGKLAVCTVTNKNETWMRRVVYALFETGRVLVVMNTLRAFTRVFSSQPSAASFGFDDRARALSSDMERKRSGGPSQRGGIRGPSGGKGGFCPARAGIRADMQTPVDCMVITVLREVGDDGRPAAFPGLLGLDGRGHLHDNQCHAIRRRPNRSLKGGSFQKNDTSQRRGGWSCLIPLVQMLSVAC